MTVRIQVSLDTVLVGTSETATMTDQVRLYACQWYAWTSGMMTILMSEGQLYFAANDVTRGTLNLSDILAYHYM